MCQRTCRRKRVLQQTVDKLFVLKHICDMHSRLDDLVSTRRTSTRGLHHQRLADMLANVDLVQAWFCRFPQGDMRRWCTRCNVWHPVDVFEGRYRTCVGRQFKRAREEAEAVDALVDAQRAATDAGVGHGGAPERYDVAWGQQSEVVDGRDARVQLREALGDDGALRWAKSVIGERVCVMDPVQTALEELARQLEGRQSSLHSQAGFPMPAPRAPTTCARCRRPTSPDAFVGQSTCILCMCNGGGLSIVEVNFALVTSQLTGIGSPLLRLRCLCVLLSTVATDMWGVCVSLSALLLCAHMRCCMSRRMCSVPTLGRGNMCMTPR